MRRSYLVILLISMVTATANSQKNDKLTDLLSSYFPILPYNKEVIAFANELIADPDLTVDTIQETGLFYLRGYYKSFNPFNFETAKVELQFHQARLTNSRSNTIDTFYILRIIGYPKLKYMIELLRDEFHYLNKRLFKILSHSVYNGKKKKGESQTFYHDRTQRLPVMYTAWGPSYKDFIPAYSITLYLWKTDNRNLNTNK